MDIYEAIKTVLEAVIVGGIIWLGRISVQLKILLELLQFETKSQDLMLKDSREQSAEQMKRIIELERAVHITQTNLENAMKSEDRLAESFEALQDKVHELKPMLESNFKELNSRIKYKN